ncbi:hypothetical protein ACRQ5Q_13430 [Bradyrhizobium sp. PMVTL-01]|uniref:hypothetical protein n=1 Tax=Bradyrhizobium sp. PMVTL-01 TaxID=3434999 RepID=UPI003F70F28C
MSGLEMARKRIGHRLRSVTRHSLATLLATTALGVVTAHAVDGTWTGASTDWTDPTNWSSNPSDRTEPRPSRTQAARASTITTLS